VTGELQLECELLCPAWDEGPGPVVGRAAAREGNEEIHFIFDRPVSTARCAGLEDNLSPAGGMGGWVAQVRVSGDFRINIFVSQIRRQYRAQSRERIQSHDTSDSVELDLDHPVSSSSTGRPTVVSPSASECCLD
jgi:hypothetical protein